SFNVTDGQLPLLAGCTNLNVAGDMDGAANGQIRAEVYFPGADAPIDGFAIKYLIRVSDTNVAAAFTPLTNSFEVRQKVFPQGVTGKVVAGGSGFPLTNAVVVAVPVNLPGAYGAIADRAGNFTLYTPPGPYYLVTAYTNSLLTRAFTVTPNAFTSQNFTSSPAPFTISGKVSDSSSGVGLPGILMLVQGSDGFNIGFTDTNGNYGMAVTSGQWAIQPNAVAGLGYVGFDNGVETNVTGNVPGVNFSIPKATALIYGRLVDNFGNPVVGIDFRTENPPNRYYEPDGRSYAANGDYCLAVIAGDWEIQPEEDTLGPRGFVGSGSSSVSLANGQCVRRDFTVLRATNHITGYVKDSGNNPITDIQVQANASFGGTNYHASTRTDNTGHYSLPVSAGDWSVDVECNDDDGLIANGFCCVDNQNVNISGGDGVASFTAVQSGQVLITTSSPLPNGKVGEFYQIQFAGSGCQTPFNWSLSPGSPPSGLNFFSDGTLSGVPGTAGSNYFSVRVTDSGSQTSDKAFSLIIVGSAQPLQVTTTSLPNGTFNTAYSQTVHASGGQQPYNWSLASGPPLPPGLNLSSGGTISGTPTNSGTFFFNVRVTDALSATADGLLSIYIPAPPLQITTLSLPNAQQGASYTNQLQASGGQLPYGWSLAPGSPSLPLNLNLSTGGGISGTPETNGTFFFIVQVTDANSTFANRSLSLTINPKPTLTALNHTGNQFQLRLTGTTGQTYTIQYSTTLTGLDWLPLLSTNPTFSPITVLDPNATNAFRAYRARVGP
ncbi:MAG TPA: hypothetical protein VFA77_02695, partial [Candidatus Eisenbacteria bacterium]|nr:hypothetical protein [Candidatus Eisenbacteria bacterium]